MVGREQPRAGSPPASARSPAGRPSAPPRGCRRPARPWRAEATAPRTRARRRRPSARRSPPRRDGRPRVPRRWRRAGRRRPRGPRRPRSPGSRTPPRRSRRAVPAAADGTPCAAAVTRPAGSSALVVSTAAAISTQTATDGTSQVQSIAIPTRPVAITPRAAPAAAPPGCLARRMPGRPDCREEGDEGGKSGDPELGEELERLGVSVLDRRLEAAVAVPVEAVAAGADPPQRLVGECIERRRPELSPARPGDRELRAVRRSPRGPRWPRSRRRSCPARRSAPAPRERRAPRRGRGASAAR